MPSKLKFCLETSKVTERQFAFVIDIHESHLRSALRGKASEEPILKRVGEKMPSLLDFANQRTKTSFRIPNHILSRIDGFAEDLCVSRTEALLRILELSL